MFLYTSVMQNIEQKEVTLQVTKHDLILLFALKIIIY